MLRFDVGVKRVVTLSTAIAVDAATKEEAEALAAQCALDGELTWAVQDDYVWQADSEEAQIDWIEEA